MIFEKLAFESALKIYVHCECTSERFFTITEVGQEFSSTAIWSFIFMVLHFPALRFGPLFSRSDAYIVYCVHFARCVHVY